VLRTPDERFAGLEQWPYEPKYVDVGGGLRMHYVDEGPRSSSPVVLAHGEPTWGYLYRKMIPGLTAGGRRVIVPDLIGFGRSDKPADRGEYTYVRHVEWTRDLIEALQLDDIVLFGQDWGGFIFLVHVGQMPERFAGVVAANTALPGMPNLAGELAPDALAPFLAWLAWSQEQDDLLPSEIVGGNSPLNQTRHKLTDGERAAYDAPFPDESYCAGARQFPLLVPLSDADPPAATLRAAWAGLQRFRRPFITAFAEHDDITGFFDNIFQERVPGARGRAHHTIPNAGHFLQEHVPERLVDIILGLGDN
jgi:haloalkane dehalogenase